MVSAILEWIHCPVCGNKTRLQIRTDTELKNFPLYCPKCKQESLIDAKNLKITVINIMLRKFRFCDSFPPFWIWVPIFSSMGEFPPTTWAACPAPPGISG